MKSTGGSATPRLGESGLLQDHASEPSHYLTDGVNLYRCVGMIPNPVSDMIALENCRSLDVTLWPIAELRARQLRGVSPSVGDRNVSNDHSK